MPTKQALSIYLSEISLCTASKSFQLILQNSRNNMKSFARMSFRPSCKYKEVFCTIDAARIAYADELYHGIHKRNIKCKYRALRLKSHARNLARFNAVSDNFLRQGITLITTHLKRRNIQGIVFEYSSSHSWNLKILPKKFFVQMI